ncbi:sugar-binding transcriptional regulator [Pararhizobium sp.]|uniref:sugar-binding transcriptional regulator n=1 Tax=Pararhizobium sp. TaxID=1977563 RepID=UPI002724D870|nr:sugar-binding transcriptional regulator [Pararhizobium sp.]MDO9416742.1 sugar-binding transcriptional regulator [Pararhizobium sp.]
MQPDRLERDIQVRNLSAEQREQLMIQVAKRYYQLDMTMGDLAAELGLTRWQASKLLSDARETGLVRIEIVPHTPRMPGLESKLQRAFGLKEAVVVPCNTEEDEALVLDGVARAAGQFLFGLGKVPAIGVSWGRTMMAVARRLPPFWNEGVEVVLLNGSMNVRSSGPQTNNVAELFARSGQGTATLLPVPAIFGHAATRRALEQDPTIAGVLELGRQVPVICFGIGALTPDSVLIQSGYLTPDDATRLRALGAVGDVFGRYINDRGEIVDQTLDDRTIGASLESCRTRQLSIGVAAGVAKKHAILSCLRARYINVLVTDEITARALME